MGGLFKKFIDVTNAPLSIASKLTTGKSLGSHATKLLNKGNQTAPQFDADFRTLNSDVQRVRDLATTEPTDLSASASVATDLVEKDRLKAMGDVASQSQGAFNQASSNMAQTGGASSGDIFRLGRSIASDQNKNQAMVSGMANKQMGEFRFNDLLRQQQLKDKATFDVVNMQALPTSLQIQQDANNMLARAQADASNMARKRAIGGTLGAVAGAFGGPQASMAGSRIGSGLFALG